MTRRFSFDLIEVALAALFLLMVANYVEYRPAAPPEWHADFEKLYGPKESQFAEEWLIRDFFQDRRGGVFVDAGAAHARESSTTYRLETTLGWSGVAIEPQPQYAEGFARIRPRTRLVQAFVSDVAGANMTLWVPEGLPALASFDKENLEKHGLKPKPLEVPTVTLNEVLDKAGIGHVDFISMDIEDAEPMALKGFDIHRFRPELLCVEAHPTTRQWLLNYFHANNYVIVGKYLPFDSVNLYFAPAARLTR